MSHIGYLMIIWDLEISSSFRYPHLNGWLEAYEGDVCIYGRLFHGLKHGGLWVWVCI